MLIKWSHGRFEKSFHFFQISLGQLGARRHMRRFVPRHSQLHSLLRMFTFGKGRSCTVPLCSHLFIILSQLIFLSTSASYSPTFYEDHLSKKNFNFVFRYLNGTYVQTNALFCSVLPKLPFLIVAKLVTSCSC